MTDEQIKGCGCSCCAYYENAIATLREQVAMRDEEQPKRPFGEVLDDLRRLFDGDETGEQPPTTKETP